MDRYCHSLITRPGAAARLICLAAALVTLAALPGCARKAKSQAPAPASQYPPAGQPVPIVPPEATTPPPAIAPAAPPPVLEMPVSPPPLPESLREAEMKFEGGDYRAAARSFEKFLREHAQHPESARADFRLGISYAMIGSSAQYQKRAMEQFRKVIAAYPDSPYRMEAEYVLRLSKEIERLKAESEGKDQKLKRLSEELERLKKIDMERRPPNSPPD